MRFLKKNNFTLLRRRIK